MNWVQLNIGAFWVKDAQKSLDKIKHDRNKKAKDQGKTWKMVKVCDHPITYKEVLV